MNHGRLLQPVQPALRATEPNTDRETNLARLKAETFDVAIIGGGIIGAAVARDAAMRGLKTAMVDKGDFAGATSSHSSKLVHGGLRYLPQGHFRLVYHALRERERLRHLTAPHLVRPLRLLFPFYRGRRPSRTAVCAGLLVYDLLARTPSNERHRRLDSSQVCQLEPALLPEGLTGGASYLDATGDDARITLENVLDAAAHGAAVANYAVVEGFGRSESRIAALFVRDVESGAAFELRARLVVNSAGPWVDEIRQLDEHGCRPLLRLTKGVHLVVERSRLPLQNSLVLAGHGNRIIFLIRYADCVLIGTTDTDFEGEREHVDTNREDANYLLDIVNQSLPGVRLGEHDITACFAGLRALRNSGRRRPSSVGREELIAVSRSGLITVAGGKLTTHREIAARLVDHIVRVLKRGKPTTPTLTEPLPGARGETITGGSMNQLPPDLQQTLASRYGSRAEIVIRIAAERTELVQRLVPGSPAIAAEVIHAVRNEFARSAADFIVRRTAMTWQAPGAALRSAGEVVHLMGRELGWNAERQRCELNSFMACLDRGRLESGSESGGSFLQLEQLD